MPINTVLCGCESWSMAAPIKQSRHVFRAYNFSTTPQSAVCWMMEEKEHLTEREGSARCPSSRLDNTSCCPDCQAEKGIPVRYSIPYEVKKTVEADKLITPQGIISVVVVPNTFEDGDTTTNMEKMHLSILSKQLRIRSMMKASISRKRYCWVQSHFNLYLNRCISASLSMCFPVTVKCHALFIHVHLEEETKGYLSSRIGAL